MISACCHKKLLAVSLILIAFAFPTNAKATSGSGAICFTGSQCVVGEFLYNDNYTAILDATCVITVTKPDGTNLLNSAAMTGGGTTGWYYYNVPAQTVTGLYPTEVRCTTGGQTMAIDKSFQYSEPTNLTSTDVENAVWNSARSSHTTTGSFGESLQNIVPTTASFANAVIAGISIPNTTQISNAVIAALPSSSSVASAVWGYSDRTLSNFGSIVGDITRINRENDKENNPVVSNDIVGKVRGLLANFKPTTSNVITNINNQSSGTEVRQPNVIENKNGGNGNSNSNAPIIRNFIESTKPRTQSKIDDVKIVAEKMSRDIAEVQSKTKLFSKTTTQKDLETIANIIGDENIEGTLVYNANNFTSSWSLVNSKNLFTQSKSARDTLALISNQFKLNSKISAGNVNKLNSQLSKMATLIGNKDNVSGQKTIFGEIAKISEQTNALDAKRIEIDSLISSLNQENLNEKRLEAQKLLKDKQLASVKISSNVLGAKTQISASNNSNNKDPQKEFRNQLYEVQGRIDSEKLKLVSDKKSVRATFWFEEGSIVFKSQIINPSTDVSQTYTLQYYLPDEVKEENVIKLDEGLTLVFDQEKNAMYVTGDVVLAPSEEKIISIEVEDIFQYPETVLNGLRKQAQTLAGTLKNTQYYGQGVTIQTDVEVKLDKIKAQQDSAETPENKIKTYRAAKIEYQGVESEIVKLKDLASEASSANSLVGFVGGSQALAVWGLIIIIAGGFIFMATYMKFLRKQDSTPKFVQPIVQSSVSQSSPIEHQVKHKKRMSFGKFTSLVLAVAGISSAISGGIVYSINSNSPKVVEKIVYAEPVSPVLGESTASAVQIADQALFDQLVQNSTTSKGQQVMVVAGRDVATTIKSLPKKDAKILYTANSIETLERVGKVGDWSIVRLLSKDSTEKIIGWIENEMLIESSVESKISGSGEVNAPELQVVIIETPTGYLKVREEPEGREITRVDVGERLPVIADEGEWWEVKLKDGTFGWISKTYSKVANEPSVSF